jgi:hypothetical protein
MLLPSSLLPLRNNSNYCGSFIRRFTQKRSRAGQMQKKERQQIPQAAARYYCTPHVYANETC